MWCTHRSARVAAQQVEAWRSAVHSPRTSQQHMQHMHLHPSMAAPMERLHYMYSGPDSEGLEEYVMIEVAEATARAAVPGVCTSLQI